MLVVILSSLRYLVRRTFYGLYCPYLLPEVMFEVYEKGEGTHGDAYWSRHASNYVPLRTCAMEGNFVEHDLKLCSDFIASSFGIVTFVKANLLCFVFSNLTQYICVKYLTTFIGQK